MLGAPASAGASTGVVQKTRSFVGAGLLLAQAGHRTASAHTISGNVAMKYREYCRAPRTESNPHMDDILPGQAERGRSAHSSVFNVRFVDSSIVMRAARAARAKLAIVLAFRTGPRISRPPSEPAP